MKWSIPIYGAIFALAIFNGIYAYHTLLVFALQGIWYPWFLPAPLNFMLILSAVVSTLLHLLVTGVLAAIVEKYLPKQRYLSAFVWLGAMLAAALQTLRYLQWL